MADNEDELAMAGWLSVSFSVRVPPVEPDEDEEPDEWFEDRVLDFCSRTCLSRWALDVEVEVGEADGKSAGEAAG